MIKYRHTQSRAIQISETLHKHATVAGLNPLQYLHTINDKRLVKTIQQLPPLVWCLQHNIFLFI